MSGKSAASVAETLRRHESEGWFLPGHNGESFATLFTRMPRLERHVENAAVLACLSYDGDGHLEVLLTKRSEKVSRHKGKWSGNGLLNVAYVPAVVGFA